MNKAMTRCMHILGNGFCNDETSSDTDRYCLKHQLRT